MRLNLGCGPDIKAGYVNVDLYHESSHVKKIDLSKLPWPFESNSADEILMLDFLEHFPYSQTDAILLEVFRILKPGGHVDIQVPDFEHCALAALNMHQYLCNVCGNAGRDYKLENDERICAKCRTPLHKIADAAIRRLYGGQDNPGNFHYTAFTKDLLSRKLKVLGFGELSLLEKHHQFLNWNFKIRAIKSDVDSW